MGEARHYVANDFLNLIALPLRGRRSEGADRGGGMKVREEMRIKQAIHGSTRAPVFVNGDARKWHSSHQSLEAPNP